MEFETVKEGKNFARKYVEGFNEKIIGEYAVANTFARLPKKLDVQTMKLLGLILSKIDFKKDNRKNGVVEVRLDLNEIMVSCGIDKDYHKFRDYYKDLAKNLEKASYVETFISPTREFMGYAVQQVVIDYEEGSTALTFRLSDTLLPYFQELATHYTIVRLENAKRFKSRFSYELYLNLLSWASPSFENKWDTRVYTTKQLKEMFGLEEQAYMYQGKFNRNAFEKKTIYLACSEINMYTDMAVSYSKIKQGKSVKAYSFAFTIKTP